MNAESLKRFVYEVAAENKYGLWLQELYEYEKWKEHIDA